MRWFHVLGALLLSVSLSIACLALVGYLVRPIYSNVPQQPRAMVISTPTTPKPSPSHQERVPILLYHAIGDFEAVGQELFIEEETFEAQLQYLRSNGYTTITFAMLNDHWEQGVPLPEKPIIITFDDGYRSFYNLALPLLRAYGMTATVFVITNHLDLPRTMTPGMVRDAATLGIEFGSHSHNHLNLTTCSPEEVMPQLEVSKELLEDLLGCSIQVLAYPGGAQNAEVRRAALNAGYLMAVGTVPGVNDYWSDRFQLQRIYIERKDGVAGFQAKMEAFMGE